jgi:hypothetical protein
MDESFFLVAQGGESLFLNSSVGGDDTPQPTMLVAE